MRTVPVVLVSPEVEFGGAFGRVVIEASVSPLAQGSLDETLGLAVGAGRVRSSSEMTDAELATGAGEEARVVTRGIVGEQAADSDAEAAIVGDGGVEEGDGGSGTARCAPE